MKHTVTIAVIDEATGTPILLAQCVCKQAQATPDSAAAARWAEQHPRTVALMAAA